MIINWGSILTLSGSARQLGFGVFRQNYDREKLYYNENAALYCQDKAIVDMVKESGESNIALDIGGDSYEYPLWVLLKGVNPLIDLSYIRQPVGVKGQNFDGDFKFKIVIYDGTDTERYFTKEEIEKKVDLGSVKYLVLKSQMSKAVFLGRLPDFTRLD